MTAAGAPEGAGDPRDAGGDERTPPADSGSGPGDGGEGPTQRAPGAGAAARRRADSTATGVSAGRRLILDRWEGETAVLEDDGGRTVDLPRWVIPAGAGEGAVVVFRALGAGAEARVEVTLDPAAAAAARAEAEATLERLRKRDPGGDLTL